MRTKNLTSLLFATKVTSTRPPRPEMTVVVRGTFDIVPGDVVKELEGIPQVVQGPMTGDIFREGDDDRTGECIYPSDFADFKLNAEVMLIGSCLVPNGRRAVECPVRLTVGNWSKSLRVSGARRWKGGEITEPEGFTTMPLDYAHAFGGPGYADNPVGKGVDGQELPNMEGIDGLVLRKDDRPPPASFAPINPSWPHRARKTGTRYDAEYRKKRAPFYAEDFDWTHFHAAPPDQQLLGYLRGDEEVTFHNIHPAAPVVTTRLPSLRVRAFVTDKAGRFREVPMRLDTLFADLDKLRITLTWRGLDPVAELDLTDVTFMVIASEPLGDAPLPLDHYRAIMDAFEADPTGFHEPPPKAIRDAMAKAEQEDGEEPYDGPDPLPPELSDKLGNMGKAQQSAIRKAVARAGAVSGSPDAIKEQIRQIVADAENAPPVPPPAIPAAAGGKARVYIRESWMQALAAVADAKAKVIAGGGPLPPEIVEAEKRLHDPKLTEMDPTVREATTDVPGPFADLSGQDLSGQDLRGVDLTGAKLEGTVLIGTNLRGATLAKASFRGAMLFKADLSGADMRGADLSLCNAANAVLEETDLRETKLDDAYLAEANLRGARLDGATGTFVHLGEADLTGARAPGVRFDKSELSKAKLDGADFSGAALTRCKLLETSGRGADLRRATLDHSSMMEADLEGAKLVSARGQRTVWQRAKLVGADLSLSWFRDGQFSEVVATGAELFGADLRDGRFYRAELVGASLAHANLFGADLCKAKLGNTSFAKANLYEAKLLGAAGPNCTFEGAVIDRALFNEA